MVKSILTNRIDRQITLLLAAFFLGLYLTTAAPGLLASDAGEFQFAAWRFGLAHATGYPLYLLLGGIWQHLLAVFGVAPSTALNALNSLIGTLGVSLLYVTMRGWLVGPVAVARVAATFTAIYFGVNPTFWSQSLIAEVYPLHIVLVLAIFLAAQSVGYQHSQGSTYTRAIIALFFVIGLALTHQAMTLLLLPGVVIYLFLVDRAWWKSAKVLAGSALALSLPLLLYAYIPLRSGPQASPWLHQTLNGESLSLYTPTWRSFVDFVTGRSISVGFKSLDAIIDSLITAISLWRSHFSLPALVLVIAGLYVLARRRDWRVLALTALPALLQQAFNLFYDIGDIFVYYIPLYLMATIWMGFAVAQIGIGDWRMVAEDTQKQPDSDSQPLEEAQPGFASRPLFTLLVLGLLVLLPLRQLITYLPVVDQSDNREAREKWEAILAAGPPENAVLISNDRNEIVPLFYLQTVEDRATGITGLFPKFSPDPSFADVGATVETALGSGDGQPVYLIKAMPGLEARFRLESAVTPLVGIVGAVDAEPKHLVGQDFGPLHLTGYDLQPRSESIDVTLYWLVQEALGADYTTTVQLLDEAGEKMAQDDRPPGGVYYPTSLWKPGEILVDHHELQLPTERDPRTMLIGMYTGPDTTPLEPPLILPYP